LSEVLLTREQLEERLATLHRASLELVKNISLETLLERIGQLACEQVEAQYAAVGVLDEDGHLEKFIPIGITAEAMRRMEHPPIGLGLIGALMDTTEPIRVADIHVDPRSAGFPAHHPKMVSFLGVPVRLGDRQLGQIYLTNKLTGPEFSADDQRVIEMLASYAGVAITNARFYHQITERDRVLTRRNENLALLNEMASVLASSDNIDQVLSNILTRVLDYLRLDVGEFFLRQEDRRIFQLVLHQGKIVAQLWLQNEFQVGEGLVGITAQTGQLTQFMLQDAREKNQANKWLFHDDTLYGCLQQVICLPLNGSQGSLGVLCVAACATEPLDDLEMQFLSAISTWIGMAIENLRLNVQQRRLAVLEERERIGMDLHDGIIQDIYAVGLTLEHARLLLSENPQSSRQRIEQAIDDLNSTIRDIRAYILDLRPRKLHEENLVDGLRRLIAEFRANTLIDTTIQAPSQTLKLPQSQAVALFHISQEALANIGKHALARHVNVSLWTTPERVLLEISDNGHGFDLANTKLTLGHGLSNMQTRARNAGGELEVSSEPDSGTTILVWVPNTNEK
jgi:two-component system, NarL family, sensor histidine kinase DevS